jgi:hypothetical protein
MWCGYWSCKVTWEVSWKVRPPCTIDHHGLVWGGLRPKPSLGPRADKVIIPLDLTQLYCPGFMLAAGLPSGFTTDGVGCWGEPAISLHSHHVSLIQWTTCLLPVTRDPGSNPLGVLMWNQDSLVSVVSLQNQELTPCRGSCKGEGSLTAPHMEHGAKPPASFLSTHHLLAMNGLRLVVGKVTVTLLLSCSTRNFCSN